MQLTNHGEGPIQVNISGEGSAWKARAHYGGSDASLVNDAAGAADIPPSVNGSTRVAVMKEVLDLLAAHPNGDLTAFPITFTPGPGQKVWRY